jgi:DNA invertase Pin-like site-specific DNA recombinase
MTTTTNDQPPQASTTALYCRVSRDREGAGLAVERQETELREMAARLGLPAVIEPAYSDNDMSAYSLRKPRPGYLALLADIEAGRVTHLLAWHNDRLHRSPTELEEFIDVVEAQNVAIQTKHGGLIDLTTPGGRAVARILGAVARMESEIKTERIRSKHSQLADSGDFNGGGRRWGYEPSVTAIRTDEANMIRGLAVELLAGASLNSLAVKLTAEGWVPPGAGNMLRSHLRKVHDVDDAGEINGTTCGHCGKTFGVWRPANLGKALASPHLAALRVHKGEVVGDASWPAVIDRQTHAALKALLRDPSRKSGETNVRKYLLPGIARCGVCDGPVRSRPGDKRRPLVAYQCNDLHVYRRMDLVDKAVTKDIVARLAAMEPTGILRSPDDRARVAALQAEDEALRAREDQMSDDYADGLLTAHQVDRATVRIRARRDAIAREHLDMIRPVRVLEGLTGQPVELARATFDALTLDRKRAVIDALCTIHIDKAAHRGAAFDPDLIRVTWKM